MGNSANLGIPGTLKYISWKYIWAKIFKNGPNKFCGSQSLKNYNDMFYLNRPYHFTSQSCLSQNLFGPALNTLFSMCLYLCTKFKVFSIILTTLDVGVFYPLLTSKQIPIRVKELLLKAKRHGNSTITTLSFLWEKCNMVRCILNIWISIEVWTKQHVSF